MLDIFTEFLINGKKEFRYTENKSDHIVSISEFSERVQKYKDRSITEHIEVI